MKYFTNIGIYYKYADGSKAGRYYIKFSTNNVLINTEFYKSRN